MWVVYTYGDGGYIYAMFVTMHNFFFNSAGAGPFVTMAKISAAIGSLLIVWQIMLSMASRVVQVDWWWVIKYVILFNGLLVPQVPVQVVDKLDSTAAPTSTVDVPVAIGAISYFTSNIGNGLTQIYDNFIINVPVPHLPSLPLTLAYSQAGPLFGNMFFQNMAGFKTNDYAVQNDLPLIMSQCVIPLVGKDINYNDLATSSDILKTVAPIANPGILIPGYVKLNTNPPQTIIQDCKTAITEMDQYLDTNNSQFAQQFANRFDSGLDKAKVADQAKMGSDLYQTMIGGATTSNSNLLKQAILINAITSGFGITSVTANSSAISQAVYTAQALAQERSTQDTTSAMVSRGLVISFAVIQCLLIALFPVVCAMALLPFGFAVLKMYAKFSLWINLWPFLYSILTSIIFYYSAARSQAIASYGFNYGNAADLFSFHSGVASKAAYLFGFIPPLAWILINKSEQMVTSAVSHLMSASQASGQTSGFEAAKAQFSEGNVSLDQRNLASKTTFGQSSTTQIGSGASYTEQGGIFTAQQNKMDLMNPIQDRYSANAISSMALTDAKSTMVQSQSSISEGVRNMFSSSSSGTNSEQFNSNLSKAISQATNIGDRESTSSGAADTTTKTSSNTISSPSLGGVIMKGASAATGAAIGGTVGSWVLGAAGTALGPEGTFAGVVAGRAVGSAVGATMGVVAEKVATMLKSDRQWADQHKTDIATKSDTQIGNEAIQQIAANYAHITGYSETNGYRDDSSKVQSSMKSYNEAASDAHTLTDLNKREDANTVAIDRGQQIMRDNYNKNIASGMSPEQALNKTVLDMEDRLAAVRSNVPGADTKLSQPLGTLDVDYNKYENLKGAQYKEHFKGPNNAKSDVLANAPASVQEVKNAYTDSAKKTINRAINNTEKLNKKTDENS